MMPWASYRARLHHVLPAKDFYPFGAGCEDKIQETAAYSAVPAFRAGTKGVLHSDVCR